MSIQAKLFIDNQSYNLKYFDWGIIQGSDNNGQPTEKVRQTGITLIMDAQRATDFEEWAFESMMMKNLEIHMLQSVLGQGKTRILKCYDCHLLEFDTHYHHQSSDLPTFKLYITCGGIEPSWSTAVYSELWRKTFPAVGETTVIEQTIPQITSLKWINSVTEEENITEIGYKESASLVAVIENDQGGTASIIIEKEDGTEFENGQTQLTFTEPIEDGMIELTPMEIKEQWEEFKTSDIDKLVAKVSHGDAETKTSKPLTVLPIPKAIVDFRPAKKYNGEYGFDYMRNKSKKDHTTYKDILGTNYEYNKSKSKWVEKFTKYKTDDKYNELKCNHYDTIVLDWHKNPDGSHFEYLQSWLAIYPKQTVTLSLQIETIENVNKNDFTFEYNNKLFKLNTTTVPAQGKGKKRLNDYLQIECLQEFTTNQTIKVVYGTRQLGQLNIMANAKANRKKIDVVFVKVITNIKGTGKGKKGSTKNSNGILEADVLTKFLKQGYINLHHKEVDFDLTALDPKTQKLKYPNFSKDFGLIDTRSPSNSKIINKFHNTTNKKLVDFMEQEFNTAYPNYTNYFKVFFFADKGGKKDKTGAIKGLGGYAKAINSQAVIVFGGRGEATVTHELLHAIGLYHTFSPNKNHPYSYKKGETTNIMDYSHLTKYGNKNRNHIWYWQAKKLWGNTNIKPE